MLLAFDCFHSDRTLLRAFLRGYGWPVAADFPRRAMQAICAFQFNVLPSVSQLVDLDRIGSLDGLRQALFGPRFLNA